MASEDDGFLSRWSRRKLGTREEPMPVVPPPAPVVAEAPRAEPQPPSAPAEPPPTLDDVTRLTKDSDYTRFMRSDVDGPVRNAALHRLFADPHFNVMDGLDIYIDDYSQPDPIGADMLRRMVQSDALGLFSDQPEAAAVAQPDEDPDLRLQPDDDAGRTEPEPGAGEDAAREP
jgi:hypothetical protein